MTEGGRFKIGDFGMATFWPRKNELFEREGDKMYLAPEVLQGVYGQAADVFR
jgi:mitosis inhibitor protein kinase SWE1